MLQRLAAARYRSQGAVPRAILADAVYPVLLGLSELRAVDLPGHLRELWEGLVIRLTRHGPAFAVLVVVVGRA